VIALLAGPERLLHALALHLGNPLLDDLLDEGGLGAVTMIWLPMTKKANATTYSAHFTVTLPRPLGR